MVTKQSVDQGILLIGIVWSISRHSQNTSASQDEDELPCINAYVYCLLVAEA